MEKAHKNLEAWKQAMDLVVGVYDLTKQLPDSEKFGLTSQMRRAAVSVPSNIAEGSARQGKKETIQFYVVSRASLSELDTQLELASRLALVHEPERSRTQQTIDSVDKLLSGLIRYRRSLP